MNLTDIKAVKVPHKRKFRVGRGESSGAGKFAGRGNAGERQRSGHEGPGMYEGGQMPLFRRLPKRGFNNKNFARRFAVVNLDALNVFEDGQEITPELLREKGLAAKHPAQIKVLATGELRRKLTVKAHAFSQPAAEKIQAAGGSTVTL
jgi:large subunit ribosomal protein L15